MTQNLSTKEKEVLSGALSDYCLKLWRESDSIADENSTRYSEIVSQIMEIRKFILKYGISFSQEIESRF